MGNMILYENCYIKVISDDSCDIFFFFFVLTGVQIRASLKYSRIRGLFMAFICPSSVYYTHPKVYPL